MCAGMRCRIQRADGDEAVAAFLLHAGQAAEELVGDILAEPRLAEAGARNAQRLACAAPRASSGGCRPSFQTSSNSRRLDVVDLAAVVVEAADLQPVAVAVDHAPPGQIVDRRAPQHGLLAAGVHGDVAADAGGIGRGRIDREHQSAASRRRPATRRVTTPASEKIVGTARVSPGSGMLLDGAQALELLGVDDRRRAASAERRRRCSRCRRRAG